MTFNYAGTVQTYTVPALCKQILVVCAGASGDSYGGYGGSITAYISVTPFTVLYVYVGGSNTYNGGGAGYNAGNGGGASDIRTRQGDLTSRLLVAGGGGGGVAGFDYGGYGGQAYAGNGGTYSVGGPGYGASQTGGGPGGYNPFGNGNYGYFGFGGSGTFPLSGGGGGGYYGGGGGGYYSAGGGGSSYYNPTKCTLVSNLGGVNPGYGYVIITPSAFATPQGNSFFSAIWKTSY